MNALQSLLDKCIKGQNVSEAINEVKEAYPKAMAGTISQRTATLLNDIAGDTTNTSEPTFRF